MSGTQNDMTDFIGIPRADYGYATLKSADESHPNENKSSDLIEQDTIIDENHFKNEEIPKEQEIATNVSKNESEIQQGNATDGKLPKNELEFSIVQEETTNEIHKKNELEIPVGEEEINTHSESIVLDAATEGMKETQSSNLVTTSMKSEIKTPSLLSDCNDGSLTKQDGEVSHDSQFPGHTDKQNSNSESGLKTSEVKPNEKQISGSLQHGNAEFSVNEDGKVSQSTQVDGKVDDQNSNCEIDSKKSVVEINDASWIEYSDEDSSEEDISVDQDLPSNTKDPDGRVDEHNSCSDSNSKKSSEATVEENAEVSDEDGSEDEIFVDQDLPANTQDRDGRVDEHNSNSDSDFKKSSEETVEENAEVSDEDCSEDEIFVDQDLPANTQDRDGRVDEHNSNSDSDFKKSSEETVEEKAEESDEDTREVKISVQDLPAQQGRRTSEQVAEMISTFLNSPEYTSKLKEIDNIVKQLTAVEFVSPDLSPEDLEALEELYGQQAKFEKDPDSDSETDAEMSESNVMKRKSKLSELDEDAEEHRVASKKYKFSKDLDSKTQSGENPCCLEEQFRLAYEEANEGQQGQLQRDKEYNFPITTGSGEYMKKRYKLCKHQLDKIDAMVVNAMSLENYFSQFVDETDNYENGVGRKGKKLYKSKGIQRGNENSTEVFSSNESRIPNPGTSSARTRRYSEENVQCEEKSFHSKERFAGALRGNTKSSKFFWFGEAFNYVKNLILCVSFTGSLMVAITIAKVFGVTFPVPKSQRNNLRNNLKSSLQEFPDVNLEEL